MHTRLTRFLLVLVTTAFCTIAFASSLTKGGQGMPVQGPGGPGQAGAPAWFDVVDSTGLLTPEPLLLAVNGGDDKVYVCHVLPNGKFITQNLPEQTALKLIEEHPHVWLRGKCDDVISPS